MVTFTAIGARKGLLPPYKVKLRYLAPGEIIAAGDLLCLNPDRSEILEAWTPIVPHSSFCGMGAHEVISNYRVLLARKMPD